LCGEDSIHRDWARRRHTAEAHLLSAPDEDEGEGLRAKLVESVYGEGLGDHLNVVDAAGRVTKYDLLDVVH
jgi:hypothetical protein